MKLNINKKDLEIFLRIHKCNKNILSLVSLYLNNDSCYIDKKMINSLKKNLDFNIINDECFKILLEDLFIESNQDYKNEIHNFVYNNVKRINPKDYYNNPYYNNIRIQSIKENNWLLTYQEYKPYEAFVYKNQTVEELYTTRPSIGYFDKEFSYLTVFQNDREWMAIKPNEIETMKTSIDEASGNVLTFGLGLGYFTYMVSLKNNVNKVTVVEKDCEVINLFKKHILPKFKNKDKIEIICADAYDYYNNVTDDAYDYIFIDIWHDVSDGLYHYLNFKTTENKFNKTKISYWIEEEILIYFRSIILDLIEDISDELIIEDVKSKNEEYNRIYHRIYSLFKDEEINSLYELYNLLSDDNLKVVCMSINK